MVDLGLNCCDLCGLVEVITMWGSVLGLFDYEMFSSLEF